MNPFDDVVGSASTATAANPFDDLTPAANPFEDLAPASQEPLGSFRSPVPAPIRQQLQRFFRPAQTVQQVVSGSLQRDPLFRAMPTPTDLLAGPFARSLAGPRDLVQMNQQALAEGIGGLASIPVDPTMPLLLATGGIANVPLRIAAASALGAAPELIQDTPNLIRAAAFGGLQAGLAKPKTLAREQPAPRAPSRGFAPESVFVEPPRVTAEEAATAAREGFGTFQRPPAPPAARPRVAGQLVTTEEAAEAAQQGLRSSQKMPVTYVGFHEGAGTQPGFHLVNERGNYTKEFNPEIHEIAGLSRNAARRGIATPYEQFPKESIRPGVPPGQALVPAPQREPIRLPETPEGLQLPPGAPRPVLPKYRIERPFKRGFLALPEEPDAGPRVAKQLGAQALRPVETRLRSEADRVSRRATDVAEQFEALSRRSETALPDTETIAGTGTLAEAARAPFREAGEAPTTRQTRFSQADIQRSQGEMVRLGREIHQLRQTMEMAGDPLARATGKVADDAMQLAIRRYNLEVATFNRLRYAAGRAVKTFDQPPIPSDVIQSLREVGAITAGLKEAKARLPIYTNLLRMAKSPTLFKQQLERAQFGRDLVDAWRLNLFSVTSWTLDLVGNATELAAQTGGAVGRDLGHVVGGRATFPSLQGLFRALRRRPLPQAVQEGIGQAAGGDVGVLSEGGFTRGPGTFTTRQGLGSAALDYLVGTPLYLKGVTDTATRRFAATWHLWRQAIEAADGQGLRGLARREFYDQFWANPPAEAAEAAIREANKAGFNRPLTRWETAFAASPVTKLLFDPFARWPSQFGRAMGEWLGYNPVLLKRFLSGSASPADIGEYLGKTATGWGGLLLVDAMYDRVDFNSMEYVDEDGNRSRLAGREPFPTALFLLATIKGDLPRSSAALEKASIPFSRIVSDQGGGGLLKSVVTVVSRAAEHGRVDPGGVRRELDSTVSKLIPGQALLAALKTLLDPIEREGVGANLPGVSLTKPPRINPTTGEPLRLTQRVVGSRPFRQIGSTPIPGATRQLDEITQALSKYGLLIYRGPKSPIAGVAPSDLSEEVRREWLKEFGRQRQRWLGPLVRQPQTLERMGPDRARALIQARDRIAAKHADAAMVRAYGRTIRQPRTPTLRERRGPKVFQQPTDE